MITPLTTVHFPDHNHQSNSRNDETQDHGKSVNCSLLFFSLTTLLFTYVDRVGAKAALEPASGTYITIAYINPATGSEDINEFVTQTGFQPTGQMKFLPFDDIEGLREFLDRMVRYGGIAILVALPEDGLSELTSEQINEFASICAEYNSNGLGIIIRFGHEMNGDWNAWCMRPDEYRKKFQELSLALQSAGANQTDLAWTPNIAGNYPWSQYKNMSEAQYVGTYGTQADWDLLDTNHDGKLGDSIGEKDDPYAPFYPGDAYVDWVGVSLYHFGNKWPWGDNDLPESHKLEQSLKGEYKGMLGDETWVPSFYGTYAKEKNKPLMIAESSAAFFPDTPGGASEFDIKQNWIEQLFNINGPTAVSADISKEFPLLKCVNWFHLLKYEDNDNNPSTPNIRFDWRLSENPSVTTEWLSRVHALKDNTRYFIDAPGTVDDFECYTSSEELQLTWRTGSTRGHIANCQLKTDHTQYMEVSTIGDFLAMNLSIVDWSSHQGLLVSFRGTPGTSSGRLWIQLKNAVASSVSTWSSKKWDYDNTGKWQVGCFNISSCPFLGHVGELDLVIETASGGNTTVAIDGIRLLLSSTTLLLTHGRECSGRDESSANPLHCPPLLCIVLSIGIFTLLLHKEVTDTEIGLHKVSYMGVVVLLLIFCR